MLGKGVDDDDDDANKEMEKVGADTERWKSLRLNYRYYSSVILARDFSTGRWKGVGTH